MKNKIIILTLLLIGLASALLINTDYYNEITGNAILITLPSCTQASDCSSGICSQGFCQILCVEKKDCPGTLSCGRVGGTVSLVASEMASVTFKGLCGGKYANANGINDCIGQLINLEKADTGESILSCGACSIKKNNIEYLDSDCDGIADKNEIGCENHPDPECNKIDSETTSEYSKLKLKIMENKIIDLQTKLDKLGVNDLFYGEEKIQYDVTQIQSNQNLISRLFKSFRS